ncbi:FMN-binding negative transcriptional regulator [Robiginitalea marina]|uniref:FMN-binding negative transcriptional regulator n=1 Tax=Robiginitalea marina TaxID=2954105 RepID=A0ABT1B0J4_9FLAO|nr:FMN-binding negative transcriptional regulator [Robiginitalea marina]MCO5725360.1 FMN-binding negative transcriptional regulator [Robiginitalea marina]
MYIPDHYQNSDEDALRDFILKNPFGIVVSNGPEAPLATHLPLQLLAEPDGSVCLYGHFARANDHWRHLAEGAPVCCIFNGPQSYVSSSWYREEEVPTWNYISVHARGAYYVQSEAALLASLHQMVDLYEKDSTHPVSLHNMSRKTMRQVRGIVGFRIAVTSLEGAWKLSQGREDDHPRIIEELERRGSAASAVARAMKGPGNPGS